MVSDWTSVSDSDVLPRTAWDGLDGDPLLRWRLVSTGCLFMVQIQQLHILHRICMSIVFLTLLWPESAVHTLTVCNFSSVLSGGAEVEAGG